MVPPQLAEVKTYGWGIGLDPASCEAFFDYWEASNWETKNRKIKDWKAALRTWQRNAKQFEQEKKAPKPAPIFQQIKSTEALLENIKRQLDRLPWPSRLDYVDDGAYQKARGIITWKRTPLIAEKKKLEAKLVELHRQAAL